MCATTTTIQQKTTGKVSKKGYVRVCERKVFDWGRSELRISAEETISKTKGGASRKSYNFRSDE